MEHKRTSILIDTDSESLAGCKNMKDMLRLQIRLPIPKKITARSPSGIFVICRSAGDSA